METADMVVMGAGVMGTSIAFHLAERGAERVVLCLSLGLVLALSAGACRNRTDGTVQYPDDSFVVPDGGEPRYARDQGPTVGIDEAHRNYHTADDRYRSFANLLRDDGYRVGRFAETFTRDALGNIDVLVISNALSAEKDKEWSLPTPPAFTEEEVDVVEGWVREGGRLMLIADHMPFPGAAANLAMAFGVVFHDSYAYSPTSYDDGESLLTFSKEEGLLADHSVTRAGGGGEVPFVTTFTGQGFRILPHVRASPLLHLPDDSFLLLPTRAYDFDESAPRIPGIGLLPGVLIEHWAGRVAVVGEAAAFSAQIQEREAGPYPFGMNNPASPHNARFLLNVMGWLTDGEHLSAFPAARAIRKPL